MLSHSAKAPKHDAHPFDLGKGNPMQQLQIDNERQIKMHFIRLASVGNQSNLTIDTDNSMTALCSPSDELMTAVNFI